MADTKKEATPLTEEQLLKKATDVETQSKQLVKDQEDFQKSKVDFEKEKADFEKIRSNFQTEKSEFETEKADFEAGKITPDEKAAKVVKGLAFEIEDEKFKFRDTAPKSILFDGKARTQKDLVKDQEALLQLSSNQSLIEKIN